MSWEDGPTWERGRPARMHSRCVPLSFLGCSTRPNFTYLSHFNQPTPPPRTEITLREGEKQCLGKMA
ncbi:MAG: hypothetical protein OXI69_15075, partial [Acidobacteriota bacterium]|nr:hypothetical protein [Acidobacteriota bacterium]